MAATRACARPPESSSGARDRDASARSAEPLLRVNTAPPKSTRPLLNDLNETLYQMKEKRCVHIMAEDNEDVVAFGMVAFFFDLDRIINTTSSTGITGEFTMKSRAAICITLSILSWLIYITYTLR